MTLSNEDASIILGMIARGDDHHDIAAWFGENQGRIDDVKKGKFGAVGTAPPEKLPPKGAPGIKGRRLLAFVEKAIGALEKGDVASGLDSLKAGVSRFNQRE